MKIAVLTLKTVLDSLLTWVRNDYVYYNTLSTPAPEKSWLYSTFYGNSHGNFDYYVQAVNMISRTDVDQNKLSTRLMFDTSRANLPTIHIHMPSETPGKFTALNGQIGFSGLDDDNNAQMDLARSFGSTYDLIITGGNSEEVILIYELLQALFIAGHDTIQNYFAVFDYAGNELMVNPEIIPYNTFYRAFRVSVQDERVVRSIVATPTVEDIYFGGQAVNPSAEVEPEQPTYPPMFSDFSILGLKKVSEGGEIPDIQFDWLGADEGSTLSFIKEMLNKLYLLSNN